MKWNMWFFCTHFTPLGQITDICNIQTLSALKWTHNQCSLRTLLAWMFPVSNGKRERRNSRPWTFRVLLAPWRVLSFITEHYKRQACLIYLFIYFERKPRSSGDGAEATLNNDSTGCVCKGRSLSPLPHLVPVTPPPPTARGREVPWADGAEFKIVLWSHTVSWEGAFLPGSLLTCGRK